MTRPRIAFVFPGQASQYVGMLEELIRDAPAACKAMDEANLLIQKHNFQSFAEMAWDAASGAGADIWVTQCSMLLADTIMLAALRDRGFQPDIAIGHSYGEYLALTGVRRLGFGAGPVGHPRQVRGNRGQQQRARFDAGYQCPAGDYRATCPAT